MGLRIRPALVLPKQNKKHNIPWTPQKRVVFFFSVPLCVVTQLVVKIEENTASDSNCAKNSVRNFVSNVRHFVPRSNFASLGNFFLTSASQFAPQKHCLARSEEKIPSGCKNRLPVRKVRLFPKASRNYYFALLSLKGNFSDLFLGEVFWVADKASA